MPTQYKQLIKLIKAQNKIMTTILKTIFDRLGKIFIQIIKRNLITESKDIGFLS